MANRFWIGGTGTWDASSSAHWAATSGGAGGVSVPTSADDVFIDANSGTGTITTPAPSNTAICRNLDCTGYAGNLTLTGQLSTNPTAGGTVTFASSMTVTPGLLAINSASGTNCNLTTNGRILGALNFLSTGGGTTLIDSLTSNNTVTLTSGTLNTNSQTCSWQSYADTTTSTRTLTLGSSIITLTGTGASWNATSTTGRTVTANTATVVQTGSNVLFRGPTNWNGLSVVQSGSGTAGSDSTGTVTLANYTRTGTAVTTDSTTFTPNLTLTGTFTVTGNSLTNRVLILSSVVGTARTITAASVSLTNVDFQDVNAQGASIPWTGTSLGDCGNNANITFPASQTRYAVAAGNWSSTAMWSTSSGGAAGASVPLPQDDVFLDANSGAGTYVLNMPRAGRNLTFTGFVRTWAVTSVASTVSGDLTLSSGMTLSQTQNIILGGRANQNLTTNGVVFPTALILNSGGGTYNLQDNLSLGATLQSLSGNMNDNGHNVSAGRYDFVSTIARTVTITGTWSAVAVTPAAGLSLSFATAGLILNASTATFVLSTASTTSRTFIWGNHAIGTFTHTVAGSTGSVIFTGSSSFGTISFSDASNARTLQFTSGTVNTIGVRNIVGTSGKLMTLSATTPGVPAELVSSRPWLMGANSVNVSGNSGLTFAAGPDMDFLSVQDITGSQALSGDFFRLF